MVNEIWKILKHEHIADGYMISSYGRIKSSIDDSVKPYEPPYHSTNGYDYATFLSNKGSDNYRPILYSIDDLVAITFIPIPDKFYGKSIKVRHIDGNARNNHVDNLEWVEDIEIWKPIMGFHNIPDNMYMVSSYGNIRIKGTKEYLKLSYLKRYLYVSIDKSDTDKYEKQLKAMHRLIASVFVTNPNPEKFNVVNHIDGIRTNNTPKNLEWITTADNVHHAMTYGLTNVIPTCDLDMVRDLLLQYEGKPSVVYAHIDHDKYPRITLKVIKHVKSGDYNRSDKYDLSTLTFDQCNHYIETDVLDMIRDMLLENSSVTAVYNALDHEKYPYITKSTIDLIKYKKNYNRSNKYDLDVLVFNKNKNKLSIDDVDMVRSLLIENDGDISKTYYMINHEIYPDISKSIISHIKSGNIYKESNKYDLSKLTFRRYSATMTPEEQDMIRDMLKNKSIPETYNALDHEKYPHISIHMIAKISQGKTPSYCKTARKENNNGKEKDD